ncbi:MAG TPA: hypothetical protein VFB38_02860 [Chthonomonadaceae bacterium]|nr:hypothetical protein [Chthonomonadaceae bacterium]
MILDTYAAGAQDSIVLPTPLPQLLRPRMSNTASGDDDLGLEERLRSALRDRYEPGVRVGAEKGSAVFVDADQLSRALRPVVQYTVTGESVRATLRLRRDGQDVITPITVEGVKSDPGGLVARLAQAIGAAISKLPAP